MVFEHEIRQRSQAALDSLGGACLALRTVGRENVFECGESESRENFFLQLIGQEFPLIEGFQNSRAAGIQLRKLEHPVADCLDLHLIELASDLFPVAGNEWNRRAFSEELCSGNDRGKLDTSLAGNEFEMRLGGIFGDRIGHVFEDRDLRRKPARWQAMAQKKRSCRVSRQAVQAPSRGENP